MQERIGAGVEDEGKPVIGILLSNLGTPDQPDRRSLRRYLKQFLSDRRVVDLPRWLWWPLLHGVILNIRPQRSAKLYQSIWQQRGSPLRFHSEDQRQALDEQLQQRHADKPCQLIVEQAMRYGQPSLEATLKKMQRRGVEKIIILPLYPQYSCSTTASTFDAIAASLNAEDYRAELCYINSYYSHPGYINACAEKIQQHWVHSGQSEMLVFSYHGTPQRQRDNGDPYYQQCQDTTRAIAEKLGLEQSQYRCTFQSRFGFAPWLTPYTDKTLQQLASQGTRQVDLFCPGFSSDCLETLEEIAVTNKSLFIDAGGKEYRYISALNSDSAHIDALADIVDQHIASWVI